MSEAYVYNGIYPQLISELYTGSGEAEEAYAWAGPVLTQKFYPTAVPLEGEVVDCAVDPPVLSVNGDFVASYQLTLEPTSPARTFLGADKFNLWSNSSTGSDGERVRLDKAWGDNSPWSSSLEAVNVAMGGERLNIGKMVWPSKDTPGNFYVDRFMYVKDDPGAGGGGSRAIAFGSSGPSNAENYYLPELHLFDPTPILMGTVTGTLGNSPTNPSWNVDGNANTTWKVFDSPSEAGLKVSIKSHGVGLRVYLSRPESQGYNSNQEWVDNLGYISVTIERPGVWPESEVMKDTFANYSTSNQVVLERQFTGSIMGYDGGVSAVSDPTTLVRNEDIVLRVYKYLY